MFLGQGGSVSRLGAGGGGLNAGGVAIGRPFCSLCSEGAVLPGAEVGGLAFGIVRVGAEFILGFLGGNAHGYLSPTRWLKAMGKVMPGPQPQQVA